MRNSANEFGSAKWYEHKAISELKKSKKHYWKFNLPVKSKKPDPVIEIDRQIDREMRMSLNEYTRSRIPQVKAKSKSEIK